MLSLWMGLVIMLMIASTFIWQPILIDRRNRAWLTKQMAVILTLLLIVPTLLVYKMNGASRQVAERVTLETLQTQFGNLAGLITAMEKRLQQQPGSAQGWYLLGKLYMHAEQYQSAVLALAKANQLTPDQPEILLNYKEAQRLAESHK